MQDDFFGPSPHRPPGASPTTRFVDIVPSCGHIRTIQVAPTQIPPLTNAQIREGWAQRRCYTCARTSQDV